MYEARGIAYRRSTPLKCLEGRFVVGRLRKDYPFIGQPPAHRDDAADGEPGVLEFRFQARPTDPFRHLVE